MHLPRRKRGGRRPFSQSKNSDHADFRGKFTDHEKNRVNLLVKCNFIVFWDKFTKSFDPIFLKVGQGFGVKTQDINLFVHMHKKTVTVGYFNI